MDLGDRYIFWILFEINAKIVVTVNFSHIESIESGLKVDSDATWYGLVARKLYKHLFMTIFTIVMCYN